MKVFGIGLSRTGTKTLTAALGVLGFDVVHYPADETSLAAMARGDGRFPLLDRHDGLTDIATIPYLRELDDLHPGAKFVLTVRDKPSWLRSMQRHWAGRPATPVTGTHGQVRLLLRAAVYGCCEFNAARMSRVYDDHLDRVRHHFAHRRDDLLELDICAGQGWERLAPFLGRAVPGTPFPAVRRQRDLDVFTRRRDGYL
ncbi:sulfotransferase family protein [Nonomuraea sp. NPDC050404]|uniref:sulfotransferase family protein n=1 Tax=Nonomuraea sp. NPDC050404 TaxID=3155783 RepID=UPI0033F4A368